ncbi:MAG TPA: peptide-methionine (R)-S-oxide reductase MsrB [Candidatus Paceibacterota bacterium]
MDDKIEKTEAEWQKDLDPATFAITRLGGTERPFANKYWDEKKPGVYKCSNCGLELFTSDTKFDSGTGWPSFYDVMNSKNVITKEDNTGGMTRVEVLCARCNAHLGHLFPDGPKEKTGLRYCINSASLNLETDK